MKQQTKTLKPVYPIHQKLKMVWWLWLAFRLFGVAILSFALLSSKPSLLGGMVWQGFWLVPMVICTPYIIKGKSPYALLMISILALVYMGGSGMLVLKYAFTQMWVLVGIWLLDFILISLINIFLFMMLKRLPKMND